DGLAFEVGEGMRGATRWVQDYLHHVARGGGEVLLQQGAQRGGAGQRLLRETVQVELERLRFDDVRRARRHAELGHRQLRLAVHVQPRQLVGVPDVGTVER